MRILILANNDVGLYRFRKELLMELLKENEVYICLPDGEFVSKLVELGCKYVPCQFERRGMNPIQEIKLIRFYWMTIKNIRPDVSLTYTIKPNSYGGLVCGLKKVPYISNVTGLGTSIENCGISQKLMLAIYRIGLRKAQKVFFQNTSNYQFMAEHHVLKGAYEILPGSGVNLDENCYEPYPSEENGLRFLFVGRIMKDKGIEEYLYCAKVIHENHPETVFDIIGDYDEDSYKPLIKEYQEQGIVRFYGQQKDVHSFYKTHHVLIHPSYHEGLSNVLLEAAACGRPVIASNIHGCIETFDDGISGISFEPRNANSLVSAVEKILYMSFEDRKNMGLCGRDKVEKNFNRKLVINAYLKEISKLQLNNLY